MNVLCLNFTEPQAKRLGTIRGGVLTAKTKKPRGRRLQGSSLEQTNVLFQNNTTGLPWEYHESMRNSLALAAGLFAASLFAQNVQPPHTTLKEGDMAPDFTLPSTQGGKVTLSSFRGKNTVVLAFFPAAFTGG
jgi:hypothetical protein